MKKEFKFTGSLMDGPHIDLVEVSGLNLSMSDEEQLWETISSIDLIRDYSLCEIIETDLIDEVPGYSDQYYECYCGDKVEFKRKLKEAIKDVLGIN